MEIIKVPITENFNHDKPAGRATLELTPDAKAKLSSGEYQLSPCIQKAKGGGVILELGLVKIKQTPERKSEGLERAAVETVIGQIHYHTEAARVKATSAINELFEEMMARGQETPK